MRPTSDHMRTRLKAATRAGVIAAGSAKQVAACSRVGETQVSRYRGDYPDFMPLDVALDCDLLAGQPVITAALADMQGYRLVPVSGEQTSELTLEHVLDAVHSVGDLLKAYRDAASDGRIDASERRDLTNLFNTALKQLQDGLRAHAGGEGR